MSNDFSLGLYILHGQTPVPCADTLVWAMWLEKNRDARRVAFTEVDECFVSTVFLGVDYNHARIGAPILFETMAFGPPRPENGLRHFGHTEKMRMSRPEICSMDRYATWREAERGHLRILGEVEAYLLDTAIKADEAILAIAAKS